jgi:hypothetical protein
MNVGTGCTSWILYILVKWSTGHITSKVHGTFFHCFLYMVCGQHFGNGHLRDFKRTEHLTEVCVIASPNWGGNILLFYNFLC